MSVWYPYTQHLEMTPPLSIENTRGSQIQLADGRWLVDATSSWWCMIHGYNPPEILSAVKTQLDRFPHVMLGGLTHSPVKEAAAALVEIMPPGLDHVFFSDSGSVGVEVALKMALGYHAQNGRPEKNKFMALERGYHGDTLGAMGVGDPKDGLHPAYCLHYFDTHFLPAPPSGFEIDTQTRDHYFNIIATEIEAKAGHCAALILEPILQGAGGFHIYSPEILRFFRTLCDRNNICLIADEVATGFYRTGPFLASMHATVVPDIVVLGKGLTGGVIGHAATVATQPIFNAFLSQDPGKAFMHGPTFMGNPLAMAAIHASIKLAQQNRYAEKVLQIEQILRTELKLVSGHKSVRDWRVLGAMGVIECHSESTLAEISQFAITEGVWLRPIGPYLYTMPPYTINLDELRKITTVMVQWILSQE